MGKYRNYLRSLSDSKLFKQSAVYLISEGINKAIPFCLLPLISYYLSTEEYGIITNYNVLTQIFAVLCYSVTTVIIPVMYVKQGNEEFRKLVSNIVFINSIIAFFLIIAVILFSRSINNATSIPLEFQLLAITSILFTSFTQVNMVLWRCEEKPFKFGAYQISQTFLDVSSSVIFIIVFLLGWRGRIYSMAGISILFGLFSLLLLLKRGYLTLHLSKTAIKTVLTFALPLYPHGLSFWIKSGADKLLLTNMCGLAENGIYSVAMTFGAIISIVVVSFNNAFTPYLFKKLKTIDRIPSSSNFEKIAIVKLYKKLLFLLALFVFFSYLASHLFIILIYQESYHESVRFLPFIMIGQFFMGLYSMFVNFAHYTQKTKILGMITFSLTLFQILLSYFLIRMMGAIGSAMSSMIISIAIFVLVALYASRIYSMPWRYIYKNNV